VTLKNGCESIVEFARRIGSRPAAWREENVDSGARGCTAVRITDFLNCVVTYSKSLLPSYPSGAIIA
jgi:hypothetical protein